MINAPKGNHDIGDWSNPDKLVDRLRKEAEARPGVVICASHGAWTLCYSIDTPLGNIFSARVRQRSTKERDWTVLGRMAARIGAPDDSTPETIKTNPNTSHYWMWGGDMSSDESAAALQQARALFRNRGQA